MSIHPFINILCFIIFAAFVSLGKFSVICCGLVVLLIVWLLSRQAPSVKAWRMLKRMRIFFISILILYLWFTPGELILPSWDEWSPTYDGLILAIERICALAVLVFAVETLLRLTSREAILIGLYYLFTPFAMLGFDRHVFMIRVLLTLEAVTKESPENKEKTPFDKKNIVAYIDVLSNRLAESIAKGCEPLHIDHEIEIYIIPPPVWHQWVLPVMLCSIFYVAKQL